jgi:hypothetical protein
MNRSCSSDVACHVADHVYNVLGQEQNHLEEVPTRTPSSINTYNLLDVWRRHLSESNYLNSTGDELSHFYPGDSQDPPIIIWQ